MTDGASPDRARSIFGRLWSGGRPPEFPSPSPSSEPGTEDVETPVPPEVPVATGQDEPSGSPDRSFDPGQSDHPGPQAQTPLAGVDLTQTDTTQGVADPNLPPPAAGDQTAPGPSTSFPPHTATIPGEPTRAGMSWHDTPSPTGDPAAARTGSPPAPYDYSASADDPNPAVADGDQGGATSVEPTWAAAGADDRHQPAAPPVRQPSPQVARVSVPPDLDAALHANTSHPADDSEKSGAEPGPDREELDEYGRRRHPGAVLHPLPRCLAVANQKGGVGKTTTTVNLGASLAELGYRVLVIDLDPQGNATTGLGVNGRNLDASVYDVILHDVPVEDVIEPTTLRNLFVVPATIDLAGAEIELVPVFSRELRLRRALETVEADFDFLLIDCPPSLGLLTVNALAAAGEVLVPIQCEYYALEGLSQLLRNVNLVKSNLNNRLEVSTIVLTMYDARTKLAEQVADEVRQHFGSRVCRNVVPRTVRLSEAPSFGQPVTTFDSSSRGAIAYRELAKEVSGGAPQRVR